MKQQDHRFKARLVVGGHVIDSSDYNTYSSKIKCISVRLMIMVLCQNNLEFHTGDVTNAFCTAPSPEKILAVCGQ